METAWGGSRIGTNWAAKEGERGAGQDPLPHPAGRSRCRCGVVGEQDELGLLHHVPKPGFASAPALLPP